MLLPFFSSALNTTRLYQITLIFLAPFFVIGVLEAFRFLRRFLRRTDLDLSGETATRAIAAFLCIFVLFNTGFVYSALGDEPTSIALDDRIDYPRFNSQEIAGALWLHAVGNRTINSDTPARGGARGIRRDHGEEDARRSRRGPQELLYLPRDLQRADREALARQVNEASRIKVYTDIGPFTVRRGIIYDNGGARIYE